MTLPRSSGWTRTSRTFPRRSVRLATRTSSGNWTMPRTRCSRASSSTSGSAPRLGIVRLRHRGRLGGGSVVRGGVGRSGVVRGSLDLSGRVRGSLDLSGRVRGSVNLSGRVRGSVDRGSVNLGRSFRYGLGHGSLGCGSVNLGRSFRYGLGHGSLDWGSLGHGSLGWGSVGCGRVGGLGPAGLRGTLLRGSVLGGLGGLGGGSLGGGSLGGALGLLGVLARLALLGGGGELLLLVRARLGLLEGALSARLAFELLPVSGDLEQDANRVRGLGAHRQPVLDPLGVHLDERGVRLGVVLADLLDGAPVALGARVGDDDPVVGLPDLAQALQLDLYSHGCGLLPALGARRRTRADRGNSRRDRTDEPGRANE